MFTGILLIHVANLNKVLEEQDASKFVNPSNLKFNSLRCIKIQRLSVIAIDSRSEHNLILSSYNGSC